MPVIAVFADMDTTIPIASGETATIATGETGVTVYVMAVDRGTTELVAQAEGFSSGEAAYEVGGELTLTIASADDPGTIIDPTTTDLVLDAAYIITATVNPAVAEGESVDLIATYDDMYVTVETPVTIVGEGDSATIALSADAATKSLGVYGPATTVKISALGYAPASMDLNIGFEPGDTNDDNCVNVSDLLVVRGQLGKVGSEIDPLSADVNGDGLVNVLDLFGVRGALGKGSGCPQ
jgi:hypothetical protein